MSFETWRRARQLSAAGLAMILALGCGSGHAVPPASTSVSAAVASASPTGTAPPSATRGPIASDAGAPGESPAASAPDPSAAGSPASAAPPLADLAGAVGGALIAGDLGSYTWAESGSDAPWVVGRRPARVHAKGAIGVTFDGLVALTWSAAWARVERGVAGAPSATASGSGGLATVAPASTGDWSLRVTAAFGPGSNATYYWRVAVVP